MKIEDQWIDLIQHNDEPLKAKTPQQVKQEQRIERQVTWEEAKDQMKHYEQSRKQRR